jgi:RNA polymerase sigma factor (sigma-70 family)
MATSQMSEFIRHLRSSVLLPDLAGLTDRQLLKDYIGRLDEAALAALVHRHGSMVWGVCRRVLCDYHDAEDAFQATFLVFVRKAASIASPELLANWLYGVANQTSLKARATKAKRRTRERQVTEMPEPTVTEKDFWNDLQPLLDQELTRLPDKYRVAIILCDLEGKTRKDAARQLNVPEGTLAARLARGRVMLAKRLARHGLAVAGWSLSALVAQDAASAGVPTSLMSCTIKAAAQFAVGQAGANGAISAPVYKLTQGVLKTMYLTKLKIATPVLLCLIAFGGVLLNYPSMAAEQPAKETQVQPRTDAAKGEQAQVTDKEGETGELLREHKVLRELKCTLSQREKIEDALDEMDEKIRAHYAAQIGVALPIPAGIQPIPAGVPLPVGVVTTTVQGPNKATQDEMNKFGHYVLTNVLQKEQVERLNQIVLQVRGPRAFQMPQVVRALELSEDQRTFVERQIQKADQDIQEKTQKMVGPAIFVGGAPEPKEVAPIFEGAIKAILEKLTPKQRSTWKELAGETLKFFPRAGLNGTSSTMTVVGAAAAIPAVPAIRPGKPKSN